MTCREISDLSGISKSTVASMSKARTWEGRSVDTVEAFANACGVDIFNPHKVVKYFRNTKQVHLRKAHPAQVRMFMEIWSTGGH